MTDLSTGATTGTATLRVTSGFFALLFVYYLFPPKYRVGEGEWQKLGWGEQSVQIPAGSQAITVIVKVYGFIPTGKATSTVNAPAGGTTSLTYKAPFISFPGFPGKLTQG